MAHKQDYDLCPVKKVAGRRGPKSRRILTLADAVDDFLESQKTNNCSPTTIAAQRTVLEQLAAFARDNDWPTVDEINQRHLRKYLNYLKDRPLWFGERRSNGKISVSYYDAVYRRFRRFFNFLLAEGDIDDNPMSHIEQPKLPEKIVPIVEDDEKAKLLRVTNPRHARTKRELFQMTRDTAVLWFFYDTSARRAGISTCQVADLDLEEGSVVVVEKGDKERYQSLDRTTLKALRAYLVLRDKLQPWTGDLWVNYLGEPMGPDWIYQMLKRLGERAGVANLHPHRFRHTFITKMIEADVSQTTIEHMVGVTRIPRTYLNKIGDKQSRLAHRRHSPAAELAKKLGRMR